MKKLNLLSVFFGCLFLLSFTANATGDRNEFQNFKITPVSNANSVDNSEKMWQITYTSEDSPLTVVKLTDSKGNIYVIRSKFFEVCYVSTVKGFGAKPIKNALRKVPITINDAVINREELKKQAILTPGSVNDEKALQLIASYLPKLINDNYTHLLN